jgi:hypothetical protein
MWFKRSVPSKSPSAPRSFAVAAAFGLVTTALSTAQARCPDEKDTTLCEPHVAMFVPTVTGNAAFPRGLGTHLGGGLEILFLTWKNDLDSPGPSDGKIRLDAAILVSERDSARLMVPFRLGAAVSFERNASRSWLVPYFAADVGGIYESVLKTRMFADAGLGLYFFHTRTISVDFEGTYVVPFSAVNELHGPKLQLSASFALW